MARFNSSLRPATKCLLLYLFLVAHALLFFDPLVACQTDQAKLRPPFEITGRTMGPIAYKVSVAHMPESAQAIQLKDDVQAALDRVNESMSTYIAESDVSRFNRADSTDFQPVGAETAAVVARSLEISKLTNGAFDITVGPAVNLWNFGPGKNREFEIPSEEAIIAAKEQIGFTKLEVRANPPAIRKSNPKLKIDLSAIAKGYAVDQVAKVLDDVGCLHFMVEVGGEVYARGDRFDGTPWRIGIQRPSSVRDVQTTGKLTHGHVAKISNRAMATSGDYQNFVEIDGKRYSHTIDPKSCRPVTHNLAFACVLADDCMTADAIATAVMVLGANAGIELCTQNGFDCMVSQRESDFSDQLIESQTEDFPALKVDAPAVDAALENESGIWPALIGAFVMFALVIAGMAVGSIFGNKPIRGSCGGLASMQNEDGDSNCSICAKPTSDCVEREEATTG